MTQPQIYGLIGYPVKHSFSPAMHNAAFRSLGISAEYKLFEVKPEELEDFLLKNKDIAGFNITIPHKVKAKEILEKNLPLGDKYPRAQENLYYVTLSGAVNTVKRNNGGLEYFNTDATGFSRSLSGLGFETRNKSVLLIGCGGAGRAIIAALSWTNKNITKIYIYDNDKGALDSAKAHFSSVAQKLILEDKLGFIGKEEISDKIKECQLLVNATPAGMEDDDPCPIDTELIHSDLLVYDLIYNPVQTKLLKAAREKGARVSNGLGMLLCQGADAFELWTGKKAPIEVMRTALMEVAYK